MNDLSKTIAAINGINDLKISYDGGNEHVHSAVNRWTLSQWTEDSVSFDKTKIIDQVEKLEMELYEDIINGTNRAVRPKQLVCTDNIITNIGLTESAKRDTGEVASSLTHTSIGTGTTTPSISDTDLQTEDTGGSYARKGYAASGQRKVSGQTAKYGMLWDDGDVSSVPILITEAGVHWSVATASNMHARVTFTVFNMTTGDLFVTQINELMING